MSWTTLFPTVLRLSTLLALPALMTSLGGCASCGQEGAPGDSERPPTTDTPAPPPPSILLITLDTTRADHLSAYGYHRQTTPTLEEMASQGIRVQSAFTTMPSTDPAHLSILTGRYPRTHGTRRNGVRAVPDLDNLASWSRERGRRTAAFVSRAHVRPSELGLAGFEHEDGPDGAQRPGDVTLRRALAWLDDNGDRPYFLWVHFFDPHRPYAAPDPYGTRFVAEGVTEVPAVQRTRQLTPDREQLFTAQYDGEIAYGDSLVRRLWDRVRRDSADPLVVLTADHGEHLGELWPRHRFSFGHGKYLYRGAVHVPMLLWWGEHLPRGSRVEGLVSLVDVPETIFGLLDEPAVSTQGRSFLDSEGRPRSGRRHVFLERAQLDEAYRQRRDLPEQQFSVRDGRYSLIVSMPAGADELYDLRDDPEEIHNVADQHPRVVSRLREALDDWRRTTPHASAAGTIDPTRIEALRALGYIE